MVDGARLSNGKFFPIRQTKADNIRQMSDEELADFIAKVQTNLLRGIGVSLRYPPKHVGSRDLIDAAAEFRPYLRDTWLEWLKQEVE